MMNISDMLRLKFPNADFRKDIKLFDDGDGIIYIKEWNLDTPKPTKKQLDQWDIEMQPVYDLEQAKIANAPIYEQLDTIDLKSIRALRANDTNRLAALEAEAATLRGKLI